MYNLILADLYKIRKSAAIKILFGITAVSAAAMAIIAYLIPQGKLAASMTGVGFMFSDANIISIIGAVIAGIFICGDFDNRTIHDAVAGGSGRSAVIAGKAVAFFCALAFTLLPYAIVTGIALATGCKFGMGSMAAGFLNIVTTQAGKTFSAPKILKLLAVMLVLIILYLARLSICIPLAIILKKPVLVVAIYYGFTIFCANLPGLIKSYPTFGHIMNCTPFGGNYGLETLSTGTGKMLEAIAVSLFFVAVMLAVTYGIFRKSEIK